MRFYTFYAVNLLVKNIDMSGVRWATFNAKTLPCMSSSVADSMSVM